MPTVLFLCSGNFYRSRFAEAIFNRIAAQRELDWQAVSRGFRLHPGNVGPLSHHAIAELAARGITLPEPLRFPLVATAADLEAAALIIALKDEEHRPMMREYFPAWTDRIEYWHIHDHYDAAPQVALGELEIEVRRLIDRLQTTKENLA